MKQTVKKTKKFFAVLMCIFMLSSLALPLAGAEGSSFSDGVTITVPTSTEDVQTIDLSNEVATKDATYSICTDQNGTLLNSSELYFNDETTPEITIKNSFKDTVLTNNNDYTVYICIETTGGKSYVKLVVKNYNVSVSFYNGDTLIDQTEVVYGGSAEEAAKTAAEKIEVKYNKYYHYMFSEWVVSDESSESTVEKVLSDTRFDAKTGSALHDYNKITSETPATCAEEGSRTFECVCGRTKTEAIPKAAHTFDENNETYPHVRHEPSCTEAGSESGYCTVCEKAVDDVLPALGHSIVTDTEAKVATCTENGWTKAEHCERCDYKLESTTINAPGHTIVEYGAVEQTICTEEGYKAGKKCSKCTYIEAEPEIIQAKEHEMEAVEAKEATCTENGNTAGTRCKVCGYSEDVQIIETLGHDWETDKEAQPATCLTAGWTEAKHCKNCNEKVESVDKPATGHTEVIDPATNATCTEPAKTEGKHCSVCGEIIVAQETVGKACDHEWAVVQSAIPSTCTEPGKTEAKECIYCKEKIEPEETALIPHEYEIVEGKSDVAATCTEAGLEAERKCKYCDAKLEEKVVPALGHIDENNDNKCERCGGEVVHIDPSANCSCICHSNNVFKKFLWSKILLPIVKFLGVEKTCKCTVAHWSK